MIDADRIQDFRKSMRYSLKYTVVLAILLILIISSLGGCMGGSSSDSDSSDDSSDLYDSYQMTWNDSHEWMTVMGTTYQNNTMLEINNSAFVNFQISLEMRLAPVPFNPEGFLNFTITKTSDNDSNNTVVWSEEWVGENANVMTYNMSMTMPLFIEENDTVQLDFVIRSLGRDSSISGGSQDYFTSNFEVLVTEVGDLTEMQNMELN